MENIILIISSIILIESTYLFWKNINKNSYKKIQNPILVDTSVLIDGRIIDVARSGFIMQPLTIPRSVIGELQYLADQADSEKRSRARHGLDNVSLLQHMPGVEVIILGDGSKADEGVDERLLKLAKQYNGVICTIDYNLNKVAQVESIKVLNINDLAMGLRMAYLPGERINLELTQKGQDASQAVGHLRDGTMVVVENASKMIGREVEVEFIRSLQTAAGKMMFAKVVNNHDDKPRPFKESGFNKNKPHRNNKRTSFNNHQRQKKSRSQDSEQDLINLVNRQD
ncbi:hypothetical protein HGB24_01380 [Candidatus Saccharibacteria bacterium]|nr:hypothetical protein [Candidatus Saccharibacteria bacterium]